MHGDLAHVNGQRISHGKGHQCVRNQSSFTFFSCQTYATDSSSFYRYPSLLLHAACSFNHRQPHVCICKHRAIWNKMRVSSDLLCQRICGLKAEREPDYFSRQRSPSSLADQTQSRDRSVLCIAPPLASYQFEQKFTCRCLMNLVQDQAGRGLGFSYLKDSFRILLFLSHSCKPQSRLITS